MLMLKLKLKKLTIYKGNKLFNFIQSQIIMNKCIRFVNEIFFKFWRNHSNTKNVLT